MKRKNLEKIVKTLVVSLMLVLAFTNCSFATGGITDTTLVTGTQNLISDLTNWLLIIAPTITILLVGYYLMRKSASDEMDAKRWDNRVKIAIVCCIGVVIASGLINVLVGYYK